MKHFISFCEDTHRSHPMLFRYSLATYPHKTKSLYIYEHESDTIKYLYLTHCIWKNKDSKLQWKTLWNALVSFTACLGALLPPLNPEKDNCNKEPGRKWSQSRYFPSGQVWAGLTSLLIACLYCTFIFGAQNQLQSLPWKTEYTDLFLIKAEAQKQHLIVVYLSTSVRLFQIQWFEKREETSLIALRAVRRVQAFCFWAFIGKSYVSDVVCVAMVITILLNDIHSELISYCQPVIKQIRLCILTILKYLQLVLNLGACEKHWPDSPGK